MLFGDFDTFFSDFAQDAIWQESGESARVILDRPDEVMLGGMAVAENTQMIFPAESFSGIDEEDTVEIDGDIWVLRETPRQGVDARIMTVAVEKMERPPQ